MNRTFVTLFFAILCLSLNSLVVNATEHDQLAKKGPRDVSEVTVRKRGLKKQKKPFDCSKCLGDCACFLKHSCPIVCGCGGVRC